jgi:prepilin peptidase CpaA
MWETILSSNDLARFQWGVVLSAALVAAVVDLSSRRIPNWLTGPLLLAGFIWATWVAGLAGLTESLASCVVLALPFVLLFVFAAGGAGDAKLMGGIGAWLGLGNSLVALTGVALAGVLLALGFAFARDRLGAALGHVARVGRAAVVMMVSRGRFREVAAFLPAPQEMQTMPYGVAIFVGVALSAGGMFLWSA